MVGVPIKHGDALDPCRAGVACRHRRVVHEAEAHGARRLGVMSGRAAEAEGRFEIACEHRVHRRGRRARRDDGGVIAPFAHDRVEVDRAAPRLAQLPDRGQERGRMHPLEVGLRRGAGLLDRRLRRPDRLHHGVDPGRPLGMRSRIVLAEEVGHVTRKRLRL